MSRSAGLKNFAKGMAFLSPWLIGFTAFTLVPVGLSLYFSLCDYSTGTRAPIFRGLENYRALGADPEFWRTLRNTFAYAAMALPAGVVVSLGLAVLLNAKVPGQGVYRTIIFLPSLVPAVALAMIWMWILNPRDGPVNRGLMAVGLPGPGWLSSAEWVKPALALISLWGVGHTVVIYLAGLQDVPRELYEAAEIDGAGSWRRLWNVTLPTLSPVIYFNLIMALITTFQFFALPQIVAPGGRPARAAYFYTMYLYDKAFNYVDMGYASAMAWVLLLIILALTGLAFWTSRRWVHYQS